VTHVKHALGAKISKDVSFLYELAYGPKIDNKVKDYPRPPK
jgi:hypothetical protein